MPDGVVVMCVCMQVWLLEVSLCGCYVGYVSFVFILCVCCVVRVYNDDCVCAPLCILMYLCAFMYPSVLECMVSTLCVQYV